MPTYDYKCPNCSHSEQKMHRMNDNIQMFCFNCFKNGETIQMLKGCGGGTAIHFKGSGFYQTDYKNK